MAGVGALTAFGAYFEKIGIVALGIAGILFALHFYQKKKAKKECGTSCDVNCDCKTETTPK